MHPLETKLSYFTTTNATITNFSYVHQSLLSLHCRHTTVYMYHRATVVSSHIGRKRPERYYKRGNHIISYHIIDTRNLADPSIVDG